MFVNCPHCRTLVATDPATDLPPPFCPECTGPLRGQATEARGADANSEGSGAALAAAPAGSVADGASASGHRDSWWDHAARAHDEDDATTATTPSDAAQMDSGDASPSALDNTDEIPSDAQPSADTDAGEPGAGELGAGESGAGNAASSAPAAPARAAARVAPVRGSVPGFLRRRADAPARRGWHAPSAVAALALLLVLQILLADRDRLATQAGWRPLLSALCAGLGCALPPWREPAAFTLLQRDVRQHPTRPGALRVSASFRNDARWSQPWPRLHLSLADADGRAAGIRSFTPEEYLGGAPAQAELASGETATVAMDIIEPAPGIVSFDFGFR